MTYDEARRAALEMLNRMGDPLTPVVAFDIQLDGDEPEPTQTSRRSTVAKGANLGVVA